MIMIIRKMKWGMMDDDVEKEDDEYVEEDDDKVENVAGDEVGDDDVAEDEVEVDDVEDDEVKGRKVMMLRMLMLRRGNKVMMSRSMMLRRRTDPKTGTHTLCEPAQSKYARGNLEEKCPSPEPRRRLYASLRSRNAGGHFTRATLCGNLQEKCPGPEPRRRLCASPRAVQMQLWAFHKSHFAWKFIGKTPGPRSALV